MAGRGTSILVSLLLAGLVALSAPLTAQAPAPRVLDLATLSKEDVASATAFAQGFLAELAGETPQRALESIDFEAMLDRVLDGIGTATERAGMRDGARGPMKQSLLQVLTAAAQGDAKLKRLVMVEGQLRARYRFYGDAGITFLDFELGRRGDGWAFVGMYNLSVGLSVVDELRAMAVLLHAQTSPGLLARLFGAATITAKDLDTLTRLGPAFQAKDYALARSLYNQLPQALQESALVTAMNLQLLAQGTDQDAYAAALEDAAARFPTPKFRMLLVDAYIVRQKWSEAIRCVDEMMVGIERDAVLLMLRASIQLQSGDVAGAKKTIQEALALEPDCNSVLLGSLDVFLAAKDWPAVAAALRKLEATGDYAFRGLLVDEVWAEFMKQPESKPWH